MVSYTLKSPLAKLKQQVFFSQMRPQLLQRVYWHSPKKKLLSGIVVGISRSWSYQTEEGVTIGEPFENYIIAPDFKYPLAPIFPKITFLEVEKRENLTVEELLTHHDSIIRLAGLIKQKNATRLNNLIEKLHSELNKQVIDDTLFVPYLKHLAKDLKIKVPDTV